MSNERRKDFDARRRADSETRQLYGTQRWRIMSRMQVNREPLCAKCWAQGITTAATIADHNPPHRGNVYEFWHGPLQSLCKRCHDQDKQREEARGYSGDADEDGWPSDPRHPANAHSSARVGRRGPEKGHGGEVKSLGLSDARPAPPVNANSREIGNSGIRRVSE